MGRILGHYWKPVYCYIRRKGYDNEQAKEFTQGFFCDIVLGNELVLQAQRERGRFRSYLLTALNHYISSVHRHESAGKRRPAGGCVSLEGFDEATLPCPSPQAPPDDAFAYAWAAELVRLVLAEVKADLTSDGKETYWKLFEMRVVEPIFSGGQAPSLSQLCGELGIGDKVTASRMIVTVKRRFQSALQRHVRQYAQSDRDVGREIDELMDILSKGRPA